MNIIDEEPPLREEGRTSTINSGSGSISREVPRQSRGGIFSPTEEGSRNLFGNSNAPPRANQPPRQTESTPVAQTTSPQNSSPMPDLGSLLGGGQGMNLMGMMGGGGIGNLMSQSLGDMLE